MSRTKIKQLIAAASASLVLALSVGVGVVGASQVECAEGTHKQGNECVTDDPSVTLCHAARAIKNPYETITVSYDAATGSIHDNGKGDHSTHTGSMFDPAVNNNGDNWGDIIPPYGAFPGLNWPAGQATLENDCNYVAPTTPGGSGGETPGNNPQVLGESTAQVTTKPTGSVAAGEGGAKEISPVAVVGLSGSLAVVVAGAAFAAKRFVRL